MCENMCERLCVCGIMGCLTVFCLFVLDSRSRSVTPSARLTTGALVLKKPGHKLTVRGPVNHRPECDDNVDEYCPENTPYLVTHLCNLSVLVFVK